MPPLPSSDDFFRGGGSVLKPNHMTRYIYPSIFTDEELGINLNAGKLRLLEPFNCRYRPRPQNQGAYDTTFLTITHSRRTPPTIRDFELTCARERSRESNCANLLGLAMRLVSSYQGNTILEAGKFEVKKGLLVFAIKRTTVIALAKGENAPFAKDEAWYNIPAEKWKSSRPTSLPGGDSWWVRLNELFYMGSDRAFFNVSTRLDELGIAQQPVAWAPREDIQQCVKRIVVRTEPLPERAGEECPICGDTWFSVSDFPCELRCGHYLCLTCFTPIVDNADRTGLAPADIAAGKDPDCPFCKCPLCNDIIPVPKSREQAIQPSELHHWRYKLTQKKLESVGGKMWDAILLQSDADGYVTMVNSHRGEVVKSRARTIVRYMDAVEFMYDVPIYAMSMLHWNWERDNPTQFAESHALHEHLKKELKQLAQRKQQFCSDDLIKHMIKVGRAAFKPCVFAETEDRLDNPIFPPGYAAYRDFLCEWVARGCFMSQNSKADLMNFFMRMRTERGVRWIGVNLE